MYGWRLAGLIGLLWTGCAAAELHYEWRDSFTGEEQRRLRGWIEETAAALESLVGPFPFAVRVVFHRYEGAGEPVPWANTRRYGGQGIHFHVDPTLPHEAFQSDWTAPHELSHLVLPYLGRRNAWFAEGFASYMQYQVMHAAGVLTSDAVRQRYLENLTRAEQNYDRRDEPFADAASRLRAERKWAVMYWGGSSYFLQIDERLREQGRGGLLAVLRRYLTCCRRDREELPALLAELDAVAGVSTFSDHYRGFRKASGFPRFRHLELRPDGRGSLGP